MNEWHATFCIYCIIVPRTVFFVLVEEEKEYGVDIFVI